MGNPLLLISIIWFAGGCIRALYGTGASFLVLLHYGSLRKSNPELFDNIDADAVCKATGVGNIIQGIILFISGMFATSWLYWFFFLVFILFSVGMSFYLDREIKKGNRFTKK